MKSLLFIYNAEKGLANALLDTGHRVIKPQDYPCALCMITYGPFGMKNEWKDFTAGLPYKVSFLHKNELPTQLQKRDLDFPCLILNDTQGSEVLIDGEEFRKISNLDELKTKVKAVLSNKEA